MKLAQFRHRSIWWILLPLALFFSLPSLIHRFSHLQEEPHWLGLGLPIFLCWALSYAFRVSLIWHADARLLQWSYSLLGGQFASKEVPEGDLAATGVRYWTSRSSSHHEPIVALKNGKLLPIGSVQTSYSATYSSDEGAFREARSQAEAVARAVGIECIAPDANTTIQVIGGQAVGVPNQRQSTIFWTSVLLVLVAVGITTTLLLGPYLSR